MGDMNPLSNDYLIFIIIIAIISTILLLITAHFSEEKPEFQKDKGFSLVMALKETFKSKSFLLYLGYNFCNAFLGSIGLSYLFAYLFVLGEGGVLWYFLIFIFVGYGSSFFCIKIRKKWGMRGIILRFGIIKVSVNFFSFLFSVLINEPLIAVVGLGISTFLGGYGIFNTTLMYLSIDEDELKNGSRREGMFLGVNALIHKPAQSIGPIIATLILNTFGFIQGSDTQPPSAIPGILILMFLIPAIVSLIGLVFMYFYTYNKEKVEEMNVRLELLHQEKKNRLN
jgi:GPH family glycoside/pentoside/hexuronide:cation symporter